jgi:hypothetical protein
MRLKVRIGAVALGGLVALLAGGLVSAKDGGRRHVIIKAPKPYDKIVQTVQRLGGVVTQSYENVDAIAASIPDERYMEILAIVGTDKAFKDELVEAPRPVESGARGMRVANAAIQAESSRLLDVAAMAAGPADYSSTNVMIGADKLHAAGNYGQDVIVAIIDSGTANSPVVPALSLGGQVIGGESFVPDDPVASATSRDNVAHGTWVGTLIAANVAFGFSNTGTFIPALKLNMPNAILGECPDPPADATCQVPMVGVAPGAKLYAMKVFASDGSSAPESRIIAAMDRAITLKRNFNRGMPATPVAGDGTEDDPFQYDALNIQVVNMSVGGGTLFAGRDLEDELTTKMLREGITLTASAGNKGFAALTGGSPGSGFGALTVGAASEPAHERMIYDLFFDCGLGCGALVRPTNSVQTADFSSRGPTADGRFDPDITANGVWIFAQGTCEGDPDCPSTSAGAPLSFVSGTSFSAPTAAGAAALLRRAAHRSSASQIRNALIAGANPRLLKDDSKRIDQGHGFLDVPAALFKLRSGRVSSRIERSRPTSSVFWNIGALGFRPVVFLGDTFRAHVHRLKPGEVTQFLVPADPWTDQFTATFANITPELPPEQQNQFFGDDILVRIADAPTSYWSSPCSLPPTDTCEAYMSSEQTIAIDNPQTGLVRIAIQGDWTNAGRVSADLIIQRVRGSQGPPTAAGRVQQEDLIPVQVDVPAGTAQLVFELSWEGNWGRYPTNDLDMLLLDPDYPTSDIILDGATYDSPERVVIDSPAAGVWTAYVQGFTVRPLPGGASGESDSYVLRATADGKRLTSVPTN